MTPLQPQEIRGNWATLLSTWNTDDSLDLSRVADQIDILIGMSVDGVYSHGTAGEFHTQTEDEFDQIAHLLSQKCQSAGMPFQIGVSHMSAQISRERLRRILPLAPSAVQVILPDWFPTTEEENITFLQGMADLAGKIGLILYNPPHAKRVLKPTEVAKLASQVHNLIGLKSAGGDDTWYAEMRAHLSEISVFIPGHLLASGIERGAQGAYSNMACLNPAATQKWTDQMATDLPAALELESRICKFMDDHIVPFIAEQKYSNAACDRLMALIGNWADVGPSMRWPYRSIPIGEVASLRTLAHHLIPEFIPKL